MQRSEKISNKPENVIFENPLAQTVTEESIEVDDIMDISGTAHEKLIKLSEMI